MATTISRRVNIVVALVCSLALVACTSLRPVASNELHDGATRSSLGKSLKPQDKIIVTRVDGTQLKMVVSSASDETVVGTLEDQNQSVILRIGEISRVERRETDGAKTVLLVFAIAFGVYFVLSSMVSSALASAA